MKNKMRVEETRYVSREPRRPLQVAVQLWRSHSTFRGFLEFALIGALMLPFLAGVQLSRLGHKAISAVPGVTVADSSPTSATLPPNQASGSVLWTVPRLPDLVFDETYFAEVSEPLRGTLVKALRAYLARRPAAASKILTDADLENRYVLLMQGLVTLTQPGPASLQGGLDYLDRAFKKGEPRAGAILGVLYYSAVPGLPRDPDAGRRLLERASAAGDAAAARIVGEGYISGWMGMVDPVRAERYLRLASERNDDKGTFRLAELLFAGHGLPKNETEAERLMLKAAERGYAEAQAALGVWRLLPYIAGIADDPGEALLWLKKAASKHQPKAMHYLGMFYVEYAKRIDGLDLPLGADLFQRCAEATLDPDCLFSYATALDNGVGKLRDPVMAMAMYSLSGLGKPSPNARSRIDELSKTLTPEQQARANTIVQQMIQRQRNAAREVRTNELKSFSDVVLELGVK